MRRAIDKSNVIPLKQKSTYYDHKDANLRIN